MVYSHDGLKMSGVMFPVTNNMSTAIESLTRIQPSSSSVQTRDSDRFGLQLNDFLVCAAASLVGLLPLKSPAQTWQTVVVSQNAGGRSIAADALGHVLTAGDASDASGVTHGIALTSDATLANWLLSDDANPDPSLYSSDIYGCGHDSLGNLYSVGQLWPTASTTGEAYWYVRKSADGGQSWSTVDQYEYSPGEWNWPIGFAADNAGGVYVVGEVKAVTTTGSSKNKQVIHWLVRKSSDGGQTWTVADDVPNYEACAAAVVPNVGVFVAGPYFAGTWQVRKSVSGDFGTWSTVDGPLANAAARGGCRDSQGNIYVAGEQFITTGSLKRQATGTYGWISRRSSDGGGTWTTDDTFTIVPPAQNQNTPGALAAGAGTDSAGNAVVVGSASDGTYNHWIVRKHDAATGQWMTLDDFQPGNGAAAEGVATDAAGHLLVMGYANSGDGTGNHWVVREL